MTRRIFHLGLLAVALATAGATVALRRAARAHAGGAGGRWLCLSGSQCRGIGREDPGFPQDAARLDATLSRARQALRDRLAEPAPAPAIREQAEAVLAAHRSLTERTVAHLLVVRRHADVTQCRRLNELCARIMTPSVRGRGPGGPGWGRGRGHRYGQFRAGLGLSPGQADQAARSDPDYAVEAADRTVALRAAHARLAATLTDPNTSDAAVNTALARYLDRHAELERRTLEHVLILRPLLGPAQQERLLGLTAARGRRWRGGRG